MGNNEEPLLEGGSIDIHATGYLLKESNCVCNRRELWSGLGGNKATTEMIGSHDFVIG